MSFEMNKILGALLGAMILAMATGFIAKALINPEELAKPAYMVAGVKTPATSAAAVAPAGPEPIGPLLAGASAANGKDIAGRQCVACHTFNKGEANRIGPNLWNVFGEPIAEGHDGYAFSSALHSHDKDKWTPDLLNVWLSSPQDFAHGTKMTFVGLPKAKDRADLIAYLDSLTDHPVPLTSATPAAAPAPAAPKPAAAPAPVPAPAPPPAPAPAAASPTKPATTPAPAAAPAPAPAPAATAPAKPAATPAPATAPAATPTPAPAPGK